VIIDLGQELSRELHGAKRWIPDSIILVDPPDLVIEKPEVETGVVRDQH